MELGCAPSQPAKFDTGFQLQLCAPQSDLSVSCCPMLARSSHIIIFQWSSDCTKEINFKKLFHKHIYLYISFPVPSYNQIPSTFLSSMYLLFICVLTVDYYADDSGMFWGLPFYNDILLQEGKNGNLQTEILLRKDPWIFTFREGWAFSRKIQFNGDECVMPPPDEYPSLPKSFSPS